MKKHSMYRNSVSLSKINHCIVQTIACGILLIISFSCNLPTGNTNPDFEMVSVNDSNVRYIGRIDFSDSGKAVFAWPGVSISAIFEGSFFAVRLNQRPIPELAGNEKYNANYYNIVIDGIDPDTVIKSTVDDSLLICAENLGPGEHTITIFKRTEAFCGKGELTGFLLEKGRNFITPPTRLQRKIEFIGNSITCGYGNEGSKGGIFHGSTENSYLAYSAIAARHLNAEYFLISYSGLGVHLNSDSTMANTLPDFYNRICPTDSSRDWDFSSWTPDAVVINLGTNDFGTIGRIPDSLAFIHDYEKFIQEIRSHYPDATIFCIDGPLAGYYTIDPTTNQKISSVTIMRNYIKKTVENIQTIGIDNIHTFSLSTIDTSIGYGAEGHPNLFQHELNAAELSTFIKDKMGW